jgi:hypothetical protein
VDERSLLDCAESNEVMQRTLTEIAPDHPQFGIQRNRSVVIDDEPF